MFPRLKKMLGYRLHATDGELGRLHDVYFDDHHWTVRYLVVDTGSWLSGRLVLVSPESAGEPDFDHEHLPVNLTTKQIEQAPAISTDEPVSRQHEEELVHYFGWTPYWAIGAHPMASIPTVAQDAPEKREQAREQYDPFLRSAEEVMGYHIHASDDHIGHVEDFLIALTEWKLRYMMVDTRNWLPGRRVLVDPRWCERIDWQDRMVYLNLTRQQVRDSPEYEPEQPLTRDYEDRLYGHYGRPRYWYEAADQTRRERESES